MRWLRRPFVHFLAGGAVLFAAAHALDPAPVPPAPPARRGIVITVAQVEELRATFRQETGHAPTTAEETALVDQAVEEELLYREALARRLDRDDAIVRRMLIEKMRLLSSVPDMSVSDTELQVFLDAHRERYRQPPRVTLLHVFLGTQQRGAAVDRDALAVPAALRRRAVAPARAVERGDPFPPGHRFVASSERDLARTFGPDFARAVLTLPLATWSGPVASPYGRHLVWVEASEPGTVPPLAVVRGQVLEDYRAEQRDRRCRETVQRLRTQYDVQVEREHS